MRAEHLFSILGLVDPALIDEAMDPSAARRQQRAVWRRYAAVAACCVLVCGALFWSVRFLGMGGSDTATTEDTAGTAEEQESAATGSDGSDGGSLPQAPGGGFFSYAGPVLPLTTLEPDTGLTAERTLTLDFAPSTHADGASSQWGAGVTDRYVLTNPTADDVTVTALYPVTGSLAGLSESAPQLTVSGAAASYTLYAGGYAGAFGDENDRNGSTHNLAGPNSWEDYAALVSNGDYLTDALSGAPDLGTPVTVYDFSDVTLTGEEERPELVVSCTFDPAATTILSYDFSASNWDDGGTWRQYGQRIDPDRWGSPTLIVLGADIDYALLADYGPDAPALTGANCTVVRRETTLGEALGALCRKELEEREIAAGAMLEPYVKAAAELLTVYGPLSDAPMDRYTDGRLDDLLGEALTVDRVVYLAVPVTVPAGGTAEVTASFWKRPGYDFGGSGTGREGLQGFEVLTTAGSSLIFTGQSAAVVNTDGVEITAEDFGFDSGGTALLDPGQPRYGLEVRPLDS